MCSIGALLYITALAYNSPIKYWLCIHLTWHSFLVIQSQVVSEDLVLGVYISFVYCTYYFSVVLHTNNIKHTENLFTQAFAQFFKLNKNINTFFL